MKLIKNIKELKQGDYIQYMFRREYPRYGIFQELEGEQVFCFFGDTWEDAKRAKIKTFIILKTTPFYKLSKEEVIADVL